MEAFPATPAVAAAPVILATVDPPARDNSTPPPPAPVQPPTLPTNRVEEEGALALDREAKAKREEARKEAKAKRDEARKEARAKREEARKAKADAERVAKAQIDAILAMGTDMKSDGELRAEIEVAYMKEVEELMDHVVSGGEIDAKDFERRLINHSVECYKQGQAKVREEFAKMRDKILAMKAASIRSLITTIDWHVKKCKELKDKSETIKERHVLRIIKMTLPKLKSAVACDDCGIKFAGHALPHAHLHGLKFDATVLRRLATESELQRLVYCGRVSFNLPRKKKPKHASSNH